MRDQKDEIRKVQVTGGSTYIISLPKSWVTEMKVKPGDSLIIKKQGNSSLQVFPPSIKGQKKQAEVTIQVFPNDDPYKIARKIISLYLVGYNIIHLIATDNKISSPQREIVKNFIREKLVGIEIISDSAEKMTLQVLLSYPELSIKDALRRVCLIASSMQKDAISALEKLDKEIAGEVIKMDNEVDRFSMYIIRQIKSAVQDSRLIKEIGLENARDCLGYRLIVKSVERIADHASSIAEKVKLIKTPVSKGIMQNILATSTFANSLLEKSVSAVFKEDYEIAEEVIEQKNKIYNLEEKVVKSIFKIQDAMNLRLITESLRRIAEYSSDISEIVLNLTAMNSSISATSGETPNSD